MSETTLGPWAVREGDGNYLWEVVGKSPRGKDVVICRPAGKDRLANAKLIAAAPTMLAAHAENSRILRLLTNEMQGRIEGGKLAALQACADRCYDAITAAQSLT